MEPEKKSNGALIGLIIIIIILIVGGIYVWQTNKTKENPPQLLPETVTTGDSDELNVLEQDLNAADTNVGVDVNGID
ncbi:MAG: hypothetical protein UU13_C0014G0016 [Candidatus Nomurabacteria bacterium GW2011_GWB1_40_7]|uniref:Uncharacterized protein n=1 Tax=Candidatus Nomurabacteria bacterium GW2011_GWB1_40_7 TaxID=1618744 RepID=A0A0G0VDJ2_9BACT|nr:MAG: hypothetical protein UU13_C0014G0016 [Candidatus Nomurabacteria bacterium GW2011_GWB1_40_7]